MKHECSFCKIVERKILSFKIAENERALAFLDIAPTAKGTTLVIPKFHANDIFEVTEKDIAAVGLLIKQVSEKMRKNLNANGVNILNASGKAAQQSVFHLHFHLIPRFENDGLNAWPFKKTLELSQKEFEEIARKLKE